MRGHARAALVFVLVLLGIVLALGIVIFGPASPRPSIGPAMSRTSSVGAAEGGASAQEGTLEALPSSGGRQASSNGSVKRDATEFVGRGRIRGEIGIAPGLLFPSEWTLLVEPDAFSRGRERAEKRSLKLANGTRKFVVEDLPLGAYVLQGVAPGLNSTEARVLLVRGSADTYVVLQFTPAGMLDGIVHDANALPAVQLEVVLESKATRVRYGAFTDATGLFVFANVVDGEYTLFIGSPEAPLVPRRELTFSAPSLRAPETTLPATGALEIVTLDERAGAAPDVDITGFGNPTGAVEVRTGADGQALVPYLLPGKYRLEGKHSDGRIGRGDLEVRAGERARAILTLRSQ